MTTARHDLTSCSETWDWDHPRKFFFPSFTSFIVSYLFPIYPLRSFALFRVPSLFIWNIKYSHPTLVYSRLVIVFQIYLSVPDLQLQGHYSVWLLPLSSLIGSFSSIHSLKMTENCLSERLCKNKPGINFSWWLKIARESP